MERRNAIDHCKSAAAALASTGRPPPERVTPRAMPSYRKLLRRSAFNNFSVGVVTVCVRHRPQMSALARTTKFGGAGALLLRDFYSLRTGIKRQNTGVISARTRFI